MISHEVDLQYLAQDLSLYMCANYCQTRPQSYNFLRVTLAQTHNTMYLHKNTQNKFFNFGLQLQKLRKKINKLQFF